MDFATIAIPAPTLPNPLPTDHQALMDHFYTTWQDLAAKVREHNRAVQERAKTDGVDVSSAPFDVDMDKYDFLREPRQAEIAAVMPHKVNAAVILGNTNYQIGNGGFSQLHDNGYTASLGAVITLYKGAADLGIADADKVLAILEEFAKRLEADEKSSAPAFGYAFGSGEDEEEELRDSFDDLDTRYYAIENIEPMMQAILDRFEEVAMGAFMAGAYRKAA
jgi:hypothetical protein